MKKIFFLCCIFLITSTIIAAELSQEDFQKKLEEFKQSGDVSVFSGKEEALTSEQQAQVLAEIPQQNSFWDKWQTTDPAVKTSFWKKLNRDQKKNFIYEMSDKYKVDIRGFDENTAMGQNAVMGNARVYVDAQKIAEYNQNAGEKAIKSVVYEYKDGKDILKIFKANGATAEIVVAKDQNGFYFDPKTNKLFRIEKQQDGSFKSNNDDELTGVWNGDGNIKITANEESSTISLDYNNAAGKPDYTKYAIYKTKDSVYSMWKNPTKVKTITDEEGKNQEVPDNYPPATITLDKDGKISNLDNVHMQGKIGGYFGDDVDVFYSEDNVKKAFEAGELGAFVLLNEQNGMLKGNVAREPFGPAGTASGLSAGLLDWAKNKAEAVDLLLDSKLNNKDYLESFAKGLGLNENNNLVKLISSGSPETKAISRALVNSILKYTDKKLTHAENYASAVKKYTESPFLEVPKKGSYLDLELDNGIAKNLKNVDLRGGSLSIRDDNGKMVKVIAQATPYNYYLNSDFNKNNAQFSNINFVLQNHNLPEQKIQIYSNSNNDLFAYGIGQTKLERVGSRSYSVQGNVHVGGRLGLVNIDKGINEGIFSFQYDAEPNSIKAAQAYLSSSEDVKKYRALYNQYKQNGFSKEESAELKIMATRLTAEYYDKLSEGNSRFALTSTSSEPQKFVQQINGLSDTLISMSKGEQSREKLSPNSDVFSSVLSAGVDRAINDPRIQDQLVQRGLYSPAKLKSAARSELGNIGIFLKNNPGTSLEFIGDEKNNLYQLKAGGNTFNIDPVIGPVVSDILPMAVGSFGVNSQNEIYLSPAWNGNRLRGNEGYAIEIFRDFGLVEAAQKGEDSIRAGVEAEVESRFKDHIRTPQ